MVEKSRLLFPSLSRVYRRLSWKTIRNMTSRTYSSPFQVLEIRFRDGFVLHQDAVVDIQLFYFTRQKEYLDLLHSHFVVHRSLSARSQLMHVTSLWDTQVENPEQNEKQNQTRMRKKKQHEIILMVQFSTLQAIYQNLGRFD